ncbi:uncharacterized protein LOC126824090 [Patella vulgata]|uniref:uncharacterized protein LOC126824090 n=1 Tax=Patella vulgata TaxID=6465 RepID=UPI00217F9970|nr:uncharacterized protein LOC126824090 [Patella vulgata]
MATFINIVNILLYVCIIVSISEGSNPIRLGPNTMSLIYTKKPGLKLEGAQQTMTPCVNDVCTHPGKVRCANLCIQSQECRSFGYKPTTEDTGVCVMYNLTVYDFGSKPVFDADWDYYGVDDVVEDVVDGDWILAFRGMNGIVDKIKDVWANTGLKNNPKDTDPSCYSVTGNCSYHYRSSWLDKWDSTDIDKVRFNFYDNGDEVVSMTFNGTGSTKDNWYSWDRLLDNSRWTDLKTAEPFHFSMTGQLNRHFFVSEGSGNKLECGIINGWVVIIDVEKNFCSFDKESGPLPAFLYSSKNTKVSMDSTDVLKADVMAVFIKLKS